MTGEPAPCAASFVSFSTLSFSLVRFRVKESERRIVFCAALVARFWPLCAALVRRVLFVSGRGVWRRFGFAVAEVCLCVHGRVMKCMIRTSPFLRREGPESEPATACPVPRVLRSLIGRQCPASLNSINTSIRIKEHTQHKRSHNTRREGGPIQDTEGKYPVRR